MRRRTMVMMRMTHLSGGENRAYHWQARRDALALSCGVFNDCAAIKLSLSHTDTIWKERERESV